MSSKVSPFLLNDDLLDRLIAQASDDPAVADLVKEFRRAREDLLEITEMLQDELTHFQVA